MNSADTAWILLASAMVLVMTPGLAFFYGGLVRERQVVNTIKMSFVSLGVTAVLWALVGYSLAFAPGTSLVGDLRWAGLSGVGLEPGPATDGIPHLAFMLFQMMFAIITPALISGAVVGRMRFRAYVLFIALWSLLVYCPLAHWVWGPGGWIGEMGALDFAGGTVVHISAGVAALVAARILGPRRPIDDGSDDEPHNVPFVVLGGSLLWFGWFGFNAGSALAVDGVAVIAFVTTMLAASAAVAAWVFAETLRSGKPTATGAAIAAVVGLVAITPAAGFVTPGAALLIGAIGALASYLAIDVLRRTGLDDTLDVFACHGLGGIVGALLTGIFSTTAVNPAGAPGLLQGGAGLLTAQAIGVIAAALFSALATAAILGVVSLLVGLRTSEQAERIGIDLSEHAEHAYRREPTPRSRPLGLSPITTTQSPLDKPSAV